MTVRLPIAPRRDGQYRAVSPRPSADEASARPVRAVVADDEPLLAAALIDGLRLCWPELDVAEPLGDGESAIDFMLNERPDVAFLDIRMPGLSGLDVARIVRDEWPHGSERPSPLIVFVTAYAECRGSGLRAGGDRLPGQAGRTGPAGRGARAGPRQAQFALGTRRPDELPAVDENVLDVVADDLGLGRPRLTRICAASGDRIHVIGTEEVLFFEAADKYVNVHTAGRVLLIRRSLRELLPSLDPMTFKQVHRRVIVNVTKIRSASRASHGRLLLDIDGTDHRPPVSRAFADLFRAM